MKNDLSAEILYLPFLLPAPAPLLSVNTCSATFISRTGKGKSRWREGGPGAPSLHRIHLWKFLYSELHLKFVWHYSFFSKFNVHWVNFIPHIFSS